MNHSNESFILPITSFAPPFGAPHVMGALQPIGDETSQACEENEAETEGLKGCHPPLS